MSATGATTTAPLFSRAALAVPAVPAIPAEILPRRTLRSAAAALPAPAVGAAAALFIDTLITHSEKTQQTYATCLRAFCRFLEEEGVSPATFPTDALPAMVLEEFWGSLLRRLGRDHRTTALTYVRGVRAFCRFLDRRGWLGPGVTLSRLFGNLTDAMGRPPAYKTPRIDRRLPEVVAAADDAVRFAIAGLSAPLPTEGRGGTTGRIARRKRLELLRDRAILHTLFSTGMRRGELVTLTRADVQDGRAAQALITGKGEKERVVFFSGEALAALRAYLAARDTRAPGVRPDRTPFLFCRHDRQVEPLPDADPRRRLSTLSVWRICKAYGALVGVDAAPHDFRHDKASTLLNEGADLSEVQDLLGHASPLTTKQIYAHYDTSRLRTAFDRHSVSLAERRRRLAEGGG